ncbi:MAG TPA: M15 family metallopeptidase, partial [Polyangia bacterium]|nr:M15 family metallopeptidase [Polyangia bacterium]
GGGGGAGGAGGIGGGGGTGGAGGQGGTGGSAGNPGGPTVGDYETSGCATSVVLGLSTQIANEMECMDPSALASFGEGGGITFTGSAVLPYLDPSAITDLQAAAADAGSLQILSGFRTVAQQYLLYRWFQNGRCGISAAATPGNSNHETGRAVDLSNWSSAVGAMTAHGWSHDVPGDDAHFDHLSSPDLRGRDVTAFQRLWNLNHRNDTIPEDGTWNTTTESRLVMSPAGGFGIGSTCGRILFDPAQLLVGRPDAPPESAE